MIARLDKLARDEDVQQKLPARDGGWDLIVCDEAHKLSATFFGGEVNSLRLSPALVLTTEWRKTAGFLRRFVFPKQ